MQYVISDVSTFSSNIAMDKNVSVPQLPDQIMSPAMDQQFAFPVIDVTQKNIHKRRQWGTYKQKWFVQERLYMTSKEACSLRIIEFPSCQNLLQLGTSHSNLSCKPIDWHMPILQVPIQVVGRIDWHMHLAMKYMKQWYPIQSAMGFCL
jgi:hypothetical protein